MEKETGKNFVLIEYPGVIKNINKAFDTLGGLSNISNSYNSGRGLELKYHPDNLYQNGLQAERKNLTEVVSGKIYMVVKVIRKKRDHTKQQSICLGMVSSIYTFKNMCDFQFMPLRRNNEFFEDLVPKLVPNDLAAGLAWWDRLEEEPHSIPNFLPPYLFSRYNTPSTKMLVIEMDRNIDLNKSPGYGRNLRVERKAHTVTVLAKDPFPLKPTAEAILDADLRCKNEEPHRLLYELFQERYMWTRVAITCKTGGPWGRLWCRFGYDPRLDPESMKYQTVMVTFRQHQSIPERQRLKVSGNERGPLLSNKEYIDFSYKSGHLPAVRQMWYSICDIDLPEAQKLLKPDYLILIKKYDELHGWLTPGTINDIRKAIKADVDKVSSNIESELESSMLDYDQAQLEEEWEH